MVFDTKVKYNGIYYPAGADVPTGDKPVVENKKVEVSKKETTLTKEEVESTNNIMKLKKMAKDNGVELADKMSTSEVKELIISVLGLQEILC